MRYALLDMNNSLHMSNDTALTMWYNNVIHVCINTIELQGTNHEEAKICRVHISATFLIYPLEPSAVHVI